MTIASFAIPRRASSHAVLPARTVADWCRRQPATEPARGLSTITAYADGVRGGTLLVPLDVLRGIMALHEVSPPGARLLVVSSAKAG